MDNLNLVSKIVKGETRWFCEPTAFFDGNANGYGFKSKEKLLNAYSFLRSKHEANYQSSNLINSLKTEVAPGDKYYLKITPDFYNIEHTNPYASPSLTVIQCYVDGSTRKGQVSSWAFVALKDDKIIFEQNGLLTGEITKTYQVGGEMQAAMEAVKFCKNHNFKCDIYYDLKNLYEWVSDLFGGKPWKTKNVWSHDYRNFMLSNKQYINKMIKVKSHSDNKFNDYVDSLANQAFNKLSSPCE